jgi:hypothetical protein
VRLQKKEIPSQTNHPNKHLTRARHCAKRFNEAAQNYSSCSKGKSSDDLARGARVRRMQRRFVVVKKVEAEKKKFESRIDRRY